MQPWLQCCSSSLGQRPNVTADMLMSPFLARSLRRVAVIVYRRRYSINAIIRSRSTAHQRAGHSKLAVNLVVRQKGAACGFQQVRLVHGCLKQVKQSVERLEALMVLIRICPKLYEHHQSWQARESPFHDMGASFMPYFNTSDLKVM
jgi:hypothetical protein